LARITPPSPYVRFNYVSGATDDRTFVLLASGRRKHNGVTPERFYLLRINPSAASPAGRARLTALAPSDVSGANEVEEMALSPDGQALAAVLTRGIWDYLYVYYLRTGGTRIWIRQLCSDCRQTELGATNFLSPGTVDLSWAQNGKTLAFVPRAADNSLRLLTVSKPGSNVQLTSKVLPIRGVPFGGQWFVIDMTPDGKTVYVSYPAGRGRSEWMGLGRFSEVTSKFTVLNYLTTSNEGHGTGYDPGGNLATDNVLWTSYNGSKAIVMDAQPGQTAGVYSGGQYTPLRWPANVVDAAW
jgi:hypothetical protein